MAQSDEVRALRWELDQIIKRIQAFERRLDALERRKAMPDGAAEAPAMQGPGASAPTTPDVALAPPPLPALPVRAPEAVPPREIAAAPAASARTAAVAARFSLRDTLFAFLRKVGPQEEMGWEMALWTWWMPRIAITVLVIGVVMGMTLAIRRWGTPWMPHFRLAIGYAICIALLLVGKRVEKRARSYARVLLSGGLALSYFVTFATHYVPFTRVISRPEITLLLLAAVVIGWFTVAQLRRSVLVALAVTVLGHLTVALSTLTLETPSRFAVLGLIVLSAGSAFFLVKNRWYYVAAAGLLGSYLNHLLWLMHSKPSGRPIDFAASMAVLAVYLLLFASADFFAPEHAPRRAFSRRFRNLYAAANSAFFFVLAMSIMRAFPFSREKDYLLCFALTAFLLVFGLAYLKRRRTTALHNLYFTKASAVAALGLAYYFDGPTLTLSLALEAVVLLISARRSGLLVSRILAIAAAGVAVAHGAYTIAVAGPIAYSAPHYLGNAVPMAMSCAALLLLSQIYQRTSWATRSPETAPFGADIRKLLWQVDLIRECPVSGLNKPAEGLLFPFLFSIAASGLFLGACPDFVLGAHRGPALSMAALLLAGFGILLHAKPYTVASLLLSAGGLYWWHRYAVDLGSAHYGQPGYLAHLLYAGAAIAPLVLLSELSRLAARGHPRLWLAVARKGQPGGTPISPLPYAYALAAVELCLAATLLLTPHLERLAPLGVAALAAAAYAHLFGATAFGLAALFLVGFAAFLGIPEVFDAISAPPAAVGLAALAATAFLGEARYVGTRTGGRFLRARVSPYYLYGAVALLAMLAIAKHVPHYYNIFGLLAAGIAVAALMNVLHRGAMQVWATAFLVAAFWLQFDCSTTRNPFLWHCTALGVAIAPLLADRYFAWKGAFPQRVPGAILAVVACIAFMVYAHTLAEPDWHLFWWMALSFGFLLYALRFRAKTALILSVGVATLVMVTGLQMAYSTTMGLGPLITGFSALILYWILWERLCTYAAARFTLPLAPTTMTAIEAGLVIAVSALLVVLLERIPVLANFYLTIAWTAAALCLFALSLATRQKFYRYTGSAVFVLALGRAFLIDMRRLEALFRIAGVIVLGSVLLAVAYAYIHARNRGKTALPADPPSP